MQAPMQRFKIGREINFLTFLLQKKTVKASASNVPLVPETMFFPVWVDGNPGGLGPEIHVEEESKWEDASAAITNGQMSKR